jgi:hypothetical protein
MGSLSTVDEGIYRRVSDALGRLKADLDAIAATEPDSAELRRAITRYSGTFAELGRTRVDRLVMPPMDEI